MAEQFTIPTKGDLIAGKYRVNHELGRGAYGIVFLCEQEEIGRDVAVKTLLPQAFLQGDVVKRFHREAQLISRLDHPNIIRLFDYGVDDGLLYMAVEYVLGQTLADIIEKEAPLDPDRVLPIIHQILDALEHAHTTGIVHRDLKPENIVILETDGMLDVKVLDFGISKVMLGDDRSAMNTLTQDGTVLGTPHYMSPENIVGDPVDHRADIYALGIMIYEMLTGEHPYDAPSPSAVFVRHLRDEPPLLPNHIQAEPLGVAAYRALAKQPDDRIESAVAFRDILNADPETLKPKKEGAPLWLILAASVLLSILAASVGWKIWWAAEKATETAVVVPKEETPDPKEAPEELPDEMVIVEDELEPLIIPEFVSAMTASSTLFYQSLRFATNSAQEKADEIAANAQKKNGKTKTTKPKEKTKTVKTETTPKEKPQAAAKLRITSSPANAKVFLNGVPIGSTPLSKTFQNGSKPVKLTFTHIGFQKKSVSVVPNSGSVSVKLKKKMIGFGD